MGKKLLEIQDLKTYFYKRDSVVKAVNGVSFHVDENETLGIVADLYDRVTVIYAGQIREIAPVNILFNHPVHHYSASLIDAVPKLKTKIDRLMSIPGQPPKLDSLPPGCRFAARCQCADHQCRSEEKPMHEVESNHTGRCWHQIQ